MGIFDLFKGKEKRKSDETIEFNRMSEKDKEKYLEKNPKTLISDHIKNYFDRRNELIGKENDVILMLENFLKLENLLSNKTDESFIYDTSLGVIEKYEYLLELKETKDFIYKNKKSVLGYITNKVGFYTMYPIVGYYNILNIKIKWEFKLYDSSHPYKLKLPESLNESKDISLNSVFKNKINELICNKKQIIEIYRNPESKEFERKSIYFINKDPNNKKKLFLSKLFNSYLKKNYVKFTGNLNKIEKLKDLYQKYKDYSVEVSNRDFESWEYDFIKSKKDFINGLDVLSSIDNILNHKEIPQERTEHITPPVLKQEKIKSLSSEKNINNQTLLIDQLDIKTTLESFVKDWELDMDEVIESFEENDVYDDYEGWFNITKLENGILDVDIFGGQFELIDVINNIYEQQYLLFVKDVYTGENHDGNEVDYTSWEIEGGDKDYLFIGGEYDQKKICTEKEQEEFQELLEEDMIENMLKYQEFYFVKEQDYNKEKWYKTLEKFDLYDWEKYPSEFITNGVREWFYKNGQLRKTGEYKNGMKNGVWKEFYQDGKLNLEINYFEGKKKGESVYYYENGTKREQSNYNLDKLNGLQKKWNENGEIESETEYKNGIKDKFKLYENGKVSQEGLNNIIKIYSTEDGHLQREITCVGFTPDGPFKDFHPNGQVSQKGNWSKEKGKQGKFTGFDENGKLHYEGNYINDKIDGPFKTFYESGKLFNEGQFKEDQMDGKWIGYHENGKIRQESIYQKDNVISEKNYNEIGEPVENKDLDFNFEVSSNDEFKKTLSEFSNNNITDLNFEITLKKGCGYSNTKFYGNYKGYNFTIHGKIHGKWFETEVYDDEYPDLESFIKSIGDCEIDNLENYISFSFFETDTYSFEGGKIDWSENTPRNIIDDCKKEYGDNNYDDLISFEEEYDQEGMEFYEPKNNVYMIEITFKYKKGNINIKWINNKIK